MGLSEGQGEPCTPKQPPAVLSVTPGSQEGCAPFGLSSLSPYCGALITDEPSRVCDELLPKAVALDCSAIPLQVLPVLVEVVENFPKSGS